MTKISLLLSCLIIVLLFACKKDDSVDQQAVDRQIIRDYITENNLTVDSTESGLYYIIENPGVGENPTLSNTVKVEYKGYLTNGNVFDQTQAGQPIEFGLNQVIAGWQEGIQLFKPGGNGMLLIPSHLGYGTRGAGTSIPPNTVILFDVELVSFK